MNSMLRTVVIGLNRQPESVLSLAKLAILRATRHLYTEGDWGRECTKLLPYVLKFGILRRRFIYVHGHVFGTGKQATPRIP